MYIYICIYIYIYVYIYSYKYLPSLSDLSGVSQFNDTHRETLMFFSIQYRNGWLAAFDLFHMFTHQLGSIHSIISTDVSKM